MKAQLTFIAAALFAASAGAADVYHGLAKDNSDLYPYAVHPSADQVVGVQPGIGDNTAVYGRSGGRNPDLFSGARTEQGSYRSGGKASDIYHGFCGGNPDLTC